MIRRTTLRRTARRPCRPFSPRRRPARARTSRSSAKLPAIAAGSIRPFAARALHRGNFKSPTLPGPILAWAIRPRPTRSQPIRLDLFRSDRSRPGRLLGRSERGPAWPRARSSRGRNDEPEPGLVRSRNPRRALAGDARSRAVSPPASFPCGARPETFSAAVRWVSHPAQMACPQAGMASTTFTRRPEWLRTTFTRRPEWPATWTLSPPAGTGLASFGPSPAGRNRRSTGPRALVKASARTSTCGTANFGRSPDLDSAFFGA